MQPFVHAQASARKTGRDWKDDLAIHEFMDLAKNACPDLRHRLVLHNADLGPELAAMAFPDREDAKEIALAHVQQDLGWLPPLEAWLDRCDPSRLPRSKSHPESDLDIVRSAVAHLGLRDPEPIQRVWDLLTLPLRFAGQRGQVAGALLMSSFGPILARAVFGQPCPVLGLWGEARIVDFSWVAEGMIVAHIGVIHPLDRILECFDFQEPRRKDDTRSKPACAQAIH